MMRSALGFICLCLLATSGLRAADAAGGAAPQPAAPAPAASSAAPASATIPTPPPAQVALLQTPVERAISTYRTVVLRNDLVEIDLTALRGAILSFSLLDSHPILLRQWQADRLRQTGQKVPDPHKPLAVLDDFNPDGGNHNWITGVALPEATDQQPLGLPWTVTQPDDQHATFSLTDSGRHLTWTLSYVLPTGKTEVSSQLTLRNDGSAPVPVHPVLYPLNGIHQDDPVSDAAYLSLSYHHGGIDGSQKNLSIPTPLASGRADARVAIPDDQIDFVCLKSRFFAGIWSPDAFAISDRQAPAAPPTPAPAPAAAAALAGSGLGGPGGPAAVAAPISPTATWHREIVATGFTMSELQGTAHQAYLQVAYSAPDGSDLHVAPGAELRMSWRIAITSMRRADISRLDPIEQGVEYTDGWYRFFRLLSTILTRSLQAIALVVRNYGVAVVALTFLIKLALHRTTYRQHASMMKMQRLAPQVKLIQEQYKDNRQLQSVKQMELWKKHGVSPLGGCLPMFIQMPIFIALFQAFSHSADLRGQSFLWINDLTLPDQAFYLGFSFPLGIPVLGGLLATINPLPLIYIGVTIWMSLSQKLPSGGDPQQEQMAKTMRWMPVIFGAIFYNMPAGLVLYFTTNAVLSTIEIRMVRRQLGMA